MLALDKMLSLSPSASTVPHMSTPRPTTFSIYLYVYIYISLHKYLRICGLNEE